MVAIEDKITREHALSCMAGRSWLNRTALDWMERSARLYPSKVAQVDARRRVTFSELSALTDRVALALLKLGLRRGDIVVAQLPNVVEHLALQWGAQKIGVAACFVMMTLRASEIKYVLEFTGARVAVFPSRHRSFDHGAMLAQIRSELPQLEHAIVVGDDVPAGLLSFWALLDEAGREKVAPDYLAQFRPEPWAITNINTTTGTTGNPKFAHHRDCVSWGFTLCERSAARHDDVFLSISPVNGGGGIPSRIVAPIPGCTAVLQEHFQAEETLELIQREKVTFVCGVPAQMVKMLDVPNFGKYDLSSLRVFMYGGSVLPPDVGRELIARTGCRILTHYGSLDAGMFTATSIFDDQEESLTRVGRPMPGAEVRMLDDDRREVPMGEVGEIGLRGPGVRAGGGYFRDPEADARAVTPDGWYLSGDMGVQHPDGTISIVGRKKDMIIRGGQNISPKEIEEILITHPKVADVAVVSMPDRVMGEKACAYIAPQPGQSLTFEEMVGFLKQRNIAMYKLPERLELIDRLPMAGDGQKVNKVALRQDVEQKLKNEGKI